LRGPGGRLVVLQPLLGLGRAGGDAAGAIFHLGHAARGLLVLPPGLAGVVLAPPQLVPAPARRLLPAPPRGAPPPPAARELVGGGGELGALRGERVSLRVVRRRGARGLGVRRRRCGARGRERDHEALSARTAARAPAFVRLVDLERTPAMRARRLTLR